MEQRAAQVRYLVDWRAAIWAGLISGAIFLVLSMVLSAIVLGTPWVVPQIIASLVMGPEVLPPPNAIGAGVFLVALLIHAVLSVIFGSLVAIVVHRWGMLIGFVGGALLGLALYGVTFYAFSELLVPWVFLMRSWIMLVSHIVFGAAAGAIYEALEVEHVIVEA